MPVLKTAPARQFGDETPITPATVMVKNTGLGLAPALFRERVKRERCILDSDIALANKLHGAPIPARLRTVDRHEIVAFADRRMTWLGDVTGRAMPMIGLRDINIFESMMQRHRSVHMKALQHFGANSVGRKFFRYGVITAGQRIPIGGDLRGVKATMMRRISAWQREIRIDFGIELLLNVTEFTFDQATRTVHLHFNVLYWPHRRLRASEWAEFLNLTWRRMGTHWRDCGMVKDYAELIKYVLKSVDRDNLTAAESAWLYGELFNGRFITPYGALRGQMRDMKAARQKLAYVADGPGKPKRLRVVQLDPVEPADDDDDSQDRLRETENLIRGRTGPMSKASAWAEPGTLIEGYTATPKTGGGKRRLQQLLERAAPSRAWWDANGAPAPEMALRISDAWLCAADHAAAEKIALLCSKISLKSVNNPDLNSEETQQNRQEYMVHTTDLTLTADQAESGESKEKPPPGGRGPPRTNIFQPGQGQLREENRISFLSMVCGEDTGWRLVAQFLDNETGEIFYDKG